MCGLVFSMSITTEEIWVEEGRENIYILNIFITKMYLKYSPFLFYAQD